VLEDSLTGFDGAVLLVTHDRYFLDQVATTILAFDTRDGNSGEPGAARGVIPFASLGQWEAWRAETAAAEKASGSTATGAAPTGAPPAAPGGRKKLGYKEQREYDAIEQTLARADAALSEARAASEHPENASDHAKLVALLAAVEERQAEVDRLYARWAELEAKLTGA
jgi:ATP-binding cassette subfamily F protein uup